MNETYAQDPLRTSQSALDILLNDKQWENHWDDFLEHMVYEKDKPSFEKAYEQLRLMTKKICGVD